MVFRALSFAFVLLSSVVTPVPAQPEYINGRVVEVADGDTCTIQSGADQVRIRFFGIDAPELDQPWGEFAGEYLTDELAGELVTAIVVDEDRYGRKVCEVFLEGRSINRELVDEGLAWWYEYYAPGDYDMFRLQASAKAGDRGVWSSPDPIAPWDWRRGVRPEVDEPGTDTDTGDQPVIGSTILPDLTGNALVAELRRQYAPDRTFSYRDARHEMFTNVDNDGGKVILVYTGHPYETDEIPPHQVVNTEHTWPQSKFSHAGGAMKSDLHHLFPTYNPVNSSRGSEPFREIDDDRTVSWWGDDEMQEHIPPLDEIDRFSERGSSGFEPREAHKGNVARAMFYFYTMYGDRSQVHVSWFLPQVDTLMQWHDDDPADATEIERSRRIAELQGNANPFVLDPGLLDRVAATLN